MKCPHCGAEGTGRFCEYCGSELPHSGSQSRNNDTDENVITNTYSVNPAEPFPESLPTDFPAAPPAGHTDIPQPVYQAVTSGTEKPVSDKNKSVTLLLCFIIGIFGAHLFYVGRWKKGLLYLCTLGLFGFGSLIDLFVIAANKFTDSEDRPVRGNAKAVTLIIIAYYAILIIGALYSNSQH